VLASLEGASLSHAITTEFQVHFKLKTDVITAATFDSEMGAISTIFNLLKAGDHVVTTDD